MHTCSALNKLLYLHACRSYYRCTRSAEQGCPAKRTVQRNHHDDNAAVTTYTVVYMGEHTCTANLEEEEAPPVILETTAAAADNTTSTAKHQRSYDDDDTVVITSTASAAGSCSSGRATGTESPAISSDITWTSGSDYVDDYSWVQEMEDLISGPIRSPLHVPAADACWTIDHDHFLMMMQVVAANNDRD